MKTLEVEYLKGIKDEYIEVLYPIMEKCNNEERLLVCLYFMSELDDDSTTLNNIEDNLRKIFPPTISTNYLPKDYASFQASVIRGQFDRETENVKKGKLRQEDRLWIRVGRGRWRNTDLGNERAIKILQQNNVKIVRVQNKVFNSWELLSEDILLKTVDKSVFLYNGTGVPMNIRSFFDNSLGRGEQKLIKLVHKDKEYLANFQLDNLENPRSRIIWKADFRDLIKDTLPEYYDLFSTLQDIMGINLPKIRFEKYKKDIYIVDFITPDNIYKDLDSEETEDNAGTKDYNEENNTEGKVKYYYGKKYERNPENRRKAIEYHGTKCKICNFDFEKVYGKRGRGYIEIHHIKPLSSLESETKIDPKTDLIPVCANCHRMIHREKDNVLSIEEMRWLIEKNKSK